MYSMPGSLSWTALVENLVEINNIKFRKPLIFNGLRLFRSLPLTLFVRVRILLPLPFKKAQKPLIFQQFLGFLRVVIQNQKPPFGTISTALVVEMVVEIFRCGTLILSR